MDQDTCKVQEEFKQALIKAALEDSYPNPASLSNQWGNMIRSDEARTQAKRNEENRRQNGANGANESGKMDLRQVWFPGSHINVGGGNIGILRGVPFDYERKHRRHSGFGRVVADKP